MRLVKKIAIMKGKNPNHDYYVYQTHQDELPAEEKLAFFRETRHTFGRTALLLSGGGGLGTFHIGVVKTLFEQRLLPRVLAGSSVGSIGKGTGGWVREERGF